MHSAFHKVHLHIKIAKLVVI